MEAAKEYPVNFHYQIFNIRDHHQSAEKCHFHHANFMFVIKRDLYMYLVFVNVFPMLVYVLSLKTAWEFFKLYFSVYPNQVRILPAGNSMQQKFENILIQSKRRN